MSKACPDVNCENTLIYPDDTEVTNCPQCNMKLEEFTMVDDSICPSCGEDTDMDGYCIDPDCSNCPEHDEYDTDEEDQ